MKSVHQSEFVRGLQEESRREKLPIHVGIHEPGLDSNKVKNTVIWIDEEGKITQRYQKIHLFDVDIKNGPVLKESNGVERGMEIQPPFETGVGKVASTICFDVSSTDISPGSLYCLLKMSPRNTASVSRNQSRPQTPGGGYHHLPIRVYRPDR